MNSDTTCCRMDQHILNNNNFMSLHDPSRQIIAYHFAYLYTFHYRILNPSTDWQELLEDILLLIQMSVHIDITINNYWWYTNSIQLLSIAVDAQIFEPLELCNWQILYLFVLKPLCWTLVSIFFLPTTIEPQ